MSRGRQSQLLRESRSACDVRSGACLCIRDFFLCARAFLPSSAATAATSAAASDDFMNVEVGRREEVLEHEEHFVGCESDGDLASGEGAHGISE
jgi:hypothetical protein